MLPSIAKTAISKARDVSLKIANAALADGVFPIQLGQAKLVILPKPGIGTEKYRPSSLINVFRNVLETKVANRLRQHTEDGLHRLQYGFRRGRSAVGAMSEVTRIGSEWIMQNFHLNMEVDSKNLPEK